MQSYLLKKEVIMFRFSLILLIVLANKLEGKSLKMNLQEAMDKKMVKTVVVSLGKYQGYCIRMSLSNLTKDSLTILVEPGRRLNSVDDKNQDILVVRELLVKLKKLEKSSFDLYGFCCQASNHCPQKEAKYEINVMADTNLVKVARYLNGCNLGSNAEQEAVWAVSDNRSAATIGSGNDTLLVPLRQLVADVKGEVLPWYTLIMQNYLYSNGLIASTPKQLKGKVRYSLENDQYVTLSVCDEKGMSVGIFLCQWLKACSNKAYFLDLPINGLEKGKYVVKLSSKDKQLVAKEFEI